MYIAITQHAVFTGKDINQLNSKSKLLFELNDFKKIGNDFVINVSQDDLTFLQDKKAMSMIPIRNLYKKDNGIKYLMYILMLMTFIIMVRG